MTATPITTRLTERLGLKSPIICAPMGSAATGELAAIVSAGGGFGTIGAVYNTSAQVKTRIQAARTQLQLPPGSPVPIGVGLIGWVLDMTDKDGAEDPRLPAILEEMPTAIWLSFGELGKYVDRIREHDAKSGRKTFIFLQTGAVADAVKYAAMGDADTVVGNESGGHGRADAPPLSTLLQAVFSALPAPRPLIVAAGGITTGAQIAALLTHGADGVVLGTRFLFSHESGYTPAAKQALLEATTDVNATVRTMAYDEVGRTTGWPAEYDGRAIRNRVMEDLEEGLDIEERLALFDAAKEKGETDRLVAWAGMGVGAIDKLEPAADILKNLHEETVQALRAARSLVA
ncbi:2-nitropropane dioxygenase [Mycena kentingensis (nom. inval.)]|nr:2-nitropropane dioxygenase [Mycena kentingensis (nom. inval.)]